MSTKQTYFEITREKGDIEFGVSSSIIDLSQDDYDKLRELIVVAIGTMEEMRRNYHREDLENKGGNNEK